MADVMSEDSCFVNSSFRFCVEEDNEIALNVNDQVEIHTHYQAKYNLGMLTFPTRLRNVVFNNGSRQSMVVWSKFDHWKWSNGAVSVQLYFHSS